MKAIRMLVAGLTAALSVVLLTPGTSYACSCADWSTTKLVRAADVVVGGELTDVDEGSTLRSSGTTTYTVEVAEVFKGAAPQELVVESASSGSACGLELQGTGRSYVFFVNETPDGYGANLCGGTTLARRGSVAEVEAVTGPASGPSPGGSGSATDPDPAAVPLAIAAGAALLLPVAVLWLRVRTP